MLELSGDIGGQYAGRLLALMGADVISAAHPAVHNWVSEAPPIINGRSALDEYLNGMKRTSPFQSLRRRPGTRSMSSLRPPMSASSTPLQPRSSGSAFFPTRSSVGIRGSCTRASDADR